MNCGNYYLSLFHCAQRVHLRQNRTFDKKETQQRIRTNVTFARKRFWRSGDARRHFQLRSENQSSQLKSRQDAI